MDKDDLIKLTEVLGELGYKIKTLNYSETESKYSWEVRELELTLSLPNTKS